MKIETLLEPGDECHFIYDNKAQVGKIERIEATAKKNTYHSNEIIIEYDIKYKKSGDYNSTEICLNEKDIFKTKEDLLESL